jgi:hypothetical protein
VQENAATDVPLLGAVAVWPNDKSPMALGLLVSQQIARLRTTCAYIKLRQVEAGFGQNLVSVLQNGLEDPAEISYLLVGWHTIFHHYGQRAPAEHTEFFGPHLLHEDILAHHVVSSLAKISPVFKWWEDLEHAVKKTQEGLVSLNLADVIAGQGQTYEQRSLKHARASLWHEFIDKYLEHPSVEQHFMQQLEPQPVPIENVQPAQPSEQEIRQLIEAGV